MHAAVKVNPRGCPRQGTDATPRPRWTGRERVKCFALAAFAAALACASAAHVADTGRMLRVQMLGDVETLDPARAPELGTVNSIAPLFHQLMTYDYGSRPVQMVWTPPPATGAVAARNEVAVDPRCNGIGVPKWKRVRSPLEQEDPR